MGLLSFGHGDPTEEDHADALQEQARALGADTALLDAQSDPAAGSSDHGIFYLWPEHEEAFAIWQKCQTQWNVGMQGATGLHYPGVEVVLRRNGFRAQRLDDMFAAIQHLERGALAGFDELRSRS